ncbi:transposase [Azospirillum agricola]|nr:transposase [Azospirillum agricola]
MSKSLLSLLPPGLAVDHVTVAHDRVVVAVRARTSTVACPVCRRPSRRVHSRYSRRLGDLPWRGRVGQLDLQIRRFRCAAVECPRRIFAERLPAVALPKVRRTVRLSEAQRRIALTAGGEAGARLAACLAMPVSGDTLLRLIRAAPLPAVPTPRVIGIDDWAWRRGQRYGTIIVDLERNRPIDLLPDRHPETVAAWLKAHPEAEVVARDRAGAYADGVRAGAPSAVQVSDRWHLLRNLGDALAGVLDRHHHDLRMASKAAAGAAMEIGTAASSSSPTTAPLPAPELPMTDRHGVRQARFDEVMALHGQGWPMKRIARTLGINRKTVRTWVRAGELPVWSQRDRGSAVDRHATYLRQRWGEGCHNAARLWQEIQERGFRGQLRTVQRWVGRLRAANPPPAGAAGTMRPWKLPSKRRAAWLVVADPETIDAAEQRFVDALLIRSEGLTRAIELARAFSTMVRRQQAGRLDEWLAAAKETALAGFADGLARDLAAIRTALSLPWSTGPVEGKISRLKTIKRTMCGRAKFDLLRQRVLEVA